MTKTEALRAARAQFTFYAREHHKKANDAGRDVADAQASAEKALVNERMAEMCGAAAAQPEPVEPFEDQAGFMLACGQTVDVPNPTQIALYWTLIKEEFIELCEATDAENQVEQADAVMDLIVVLTGYALSQGWPVSALWREVVRSNMAKVDPETGMVRRREDGKVMKPIGWTPPDLASVLADHQAARF